MKSKLPYVLFVFIVVFMFFLQKKSSNREIKFHLFEGLEGPAQSSTIPKFKATSFTQYQTGSSSRMAVLLTDESSAWLGLAHGLKSIGIPFYITKDTKQALQSKVVLVYPLISGRVLKPEALKALASYPREGGTLIAINVLGGGLNQTFGFGEVLPSRKRFEIHFDINQPLMSDLTDPKEKTIRLGHKKEGSQMMGTHAYSNPKHPPLAVYEGGEAALIQNFYKKGRALAFGWDIGFLFEKGYSNREENIARSYVNDYEPTLDVILRTLKKIYQQTGPEAVTLHTVPFGKSLSVLITHDIDFTASLFNSVKYAEYEEKQKIPATYFIQTKYVEDYNDKYFFHDEGAALLSQLEKKGMDLASHSVSHSRTYSKFDMGNGKEKYPDYKAFVKSKKVTLGGTILGELRVSKFLIENFTDQTEVVSFRPGHLSNPYALPQALMAAGYRYSSSVTANNSLTHLPFQLSYNRESKAEIPIYEFPVTIEDEAAKNPAKWLQQSLIVANKLKTYGALCVVLIHTDVLKHKLNFEKEFVKAVRSFSWMGTVREFGSWWVARDKVALDVRKENQKIIVELNLPHLMEGLTLLTPENSQLRSVSPSNVRVVQQKNFLIIKKAQGKLKLTLWTLPDPV